MAVQGSGKPGLNANTPLACCAKGQAALEAVAQKGFGPGGFAAGVDADLKAANLKQLKRIEGQVRGLAVMIEDGRYCADIIQQVSAVQESLRSVAKNLYRNHLKHCAPHAMQSSGRKRDAMIDELVELTNRLTR